MTRIFLGPMIIAGSLVMACGNMDRRDPAQHRSTPAPASAAAPVPADAANVTLLDIFPPPARECDLVLNTCGSCHAVACVARGRRTAARWGQLRASHKENVTGLSSADYDTLFAYLERNFNDTKDEPRIPPKLLEQGCTPL